MINVPPTQEESSENKISSKYEKDLQSIIFSLTEDSILINNEIRTAKTSLKREYYKKKLSKNNHKLMKLLMLSHTASNI